jgi:tRNA-dihydrouridine synthase B
MKTFSTLSGHTLPSRVFSAPMAGYTDPPYRRLMQEFGIPVLFTEMIDSHALIHRNEKTMTMLEPQSKDIFVQFAAGTSLLAEHAMDALSEVQSAGININMGCPAKKVVGCGGGSNLLRYPDAIRDICRIVRKKAGSQLFSVKFRSGWNDECLNYEEVGRIYEGEGVDFVMLHARTRAQSFSGLARLDHIRRLKEILKIPVIGNGDIVSYESAKRMVDLTGCDGVAIGRGAVGNPWVYFQAARALDGLPPLSEPSPEERLRVILRHYELILEYFGLGLSSHIIRKHMVGYLKGLPGHKAVKEKIFAVESLSLDHLHQILGQYFDDLKAGRALAA